ncbi:non-ltr retroelement reverse transcriptase [Striga asiatica]|uniref:Non-ltr retroelement reverse transcriptase n=1 Tax=Striga asiatica TaxID=4170 RepID=A0A5A7QK44_STRAF|nr:non-ltr retroelement reverse transcriptase [Striga asiatica]
MGDWNEICDHSEKSGGRRKAEREFIDFNAFISRMGMQELHQIGHRFTWGNDGEAEGFIEEKIDKIFASFDWLEDNQHTMVENFFKSASDHRLLLLSDNPQNSRVKGRRFYFDKSWLKREGIQGTPMFQFYEKLKATRMALLKWSSTFRREQIIEKQLITQRLGEMSTLGNHRDWAEWQRLLGELNKITRAEETFWAQKARSQWLKEGDSNTKYFHAITMQRRKVNEIFNLMDDQNHVYSNEEDIQLRICRFYEQLFSSEGSSGDDELIQLIPQNITADMNIALTAPITKEEIKEALFSFDPGKAPGQDVAYRVIAKILSLRIKPCLSSCISENQATFIPGRQLLDNVVIAQESVHFLNRHTSGRNATCF